MIASNAFLLGIVLDDDRFEEVRFSAIKPMGCRKIEFSEIDEVGKCSWKHFDVTIA